MPLEYDESAWPIVVCTAIGESTDADLEEYLHLLGRLLDRQESHVVIVDASRGRTMKSTHRKVIASWNENNARKLARYRAGTAIVTPSAALRGILTATYWIFKPPFEHKTTETLAEAQRWAKHQLAKP